MDVNDNGNLQTFTMESDAHLVLEFNVTRTRKIVTFALTGHKPFFGCRLDAFGTTINMKSLRVLPLSEITTPLEQKRPILKKGEKKDKYGSKGYVSNYCYFTLLWPLNKKI